MSKVGQLCPPILRKVKVTSCYDFKENKHRIFSSSNKETNMAHPRHARFYKWRNLRDRLFETKKTKDIYGFYEASQTAQKFLSEDKQNHRDTIQHRWFLFSCHMQLIKLLSRAPDFPEKSQMLNNISDDMKNNLKVLYEFRSNKKRSTDLDSIFDKLMFSLTTKEEKKLEVLIPPSPTSRDSEVEDSPPFSSTPSQHSAHSSNASRDSSPNSRELQRPLPPVLSEASEQLQEYHPPSQPSSDQLTQRIAVTEVPPQVQLSQRTISQPAPRASSFSCLFCCCSNTKNKVNVNQGIAPSHAPPRVVMS